MVTKEHSPSKKTRGFNEDSVVLLNIALFILPISFFYFVDISGLFAIFIVGKSIILTLILLLNLVKV